MTIVKEYLDYKAHVCRQVYTSSRDEVDKKLEAFEQVWPEYNKQRISFHTLRIFLRLHTI